MFTKQRCALLALSCAALSLSIPSVGLTQGPQLNPNFAVFDAKAAAKQKHLKEVGVTPPFWTPEIEQVTDLEQCIIPFLKRDPLYSKLRLDFLSYGRQYFGVYRSGRKLIYLNAFCDLGARPNGKWKRELVWVTDGATCFFQVYFEPIKKEFIDFRYNSRA